MSTEAAKRVPVLLGIAWAFLACWILAAVVSKFGGALPGIPSLLIVVGLLLGGLLAAVFSALFLVFTARTARNVLYGAATFVAGAAASMYVYHYLGS